MKDNLTLDIEPVFAECFGWNVFDHYLSTLQYELFDGHTVSIQKTGTTQRETLNGIIAYLDGEIEDLTEIRDKIKSTYKIK